MLPSACDKAISMNILFKIELLAEFGNNFDDGVIIIFDLLLFGEHRR